MVSTKTPPKLPRINDLSPTGQAIALRLLDQVARVGVVTIDANRSPDVAAVADHLARCGRGRVIRDDDAGTVRIERRTEELCRLDAVDLDAAVGQVRARAAEAEATAPTVDLARQAARLTRALTCAAVESAKLHRLTQQAGGRA